MSRHRVLLRGSVAAAVVCCAISPVRAAVIPIAQTRMVSTFAFLDPGDGRDALRSSETIESGQDGPFTEHAVCHLENAGSHVTGTADQESSIGPDGLSAVIGITAEGRLVPPAQGTLAIGSSGVIYDFDVDAPTRCRLVANLEAAGDGVIDIALLIRGGPPLVRWQFFDTEEGLDHEELLPPGSYQLTVGGGGDGATGPNGSGFSSITMDFTMSFPGAAAAPSPTDAMAPPRAYPNPARDFVTLSGLDPMAGSVRIFDAAGRLVRDLAAGSGAQVVWDTRDEGGVPVAPGVYFARSGRDPVADVTISR